MTARRTGLIVGRFNPPHAGHQLAVEFAYGWVQRVAIVLAAGEDDPIPGAQRSRWLAELFPAADLRLASAGLPWFDDDTPSVWASWKAEIGLAYPDGIDCVFASDGHGAGLAKALDAEYVPVDPDRVMVPVRGRDIRDDPLGHWEFLPRCVRPHYLRRVCLFGPDGTGKSMLAEQLAIHYDTVCTYEYRAALAAARRRSRGAEQQALGQVAAEDAMARHANRVLFCDSDALSVAVRARAEGKRVPAALEAMVSGRQYDLHLLMDVANTWVDDPAARANPERARLFEHYRQALIESGRKYLRLDGDPDTRFRIACDAVDNLLGTPSGRPPRPDL